jgi:hypothetical protein
MTTKLRLFNGAMVVIGNRSLSDTGEAVEAGRALVEVYEQVVEECLSVGSWNFAMETIMAESDTGISPSFGFAQVFAKPTDWLRTIGISEDPYFSAPLLKYYDDVSFWSSDSSPIYVRYVSNDTGLGMELSRWPANFARYVELELAARVCYRLTQNFALVDSTEKARDKARRRALNVDAMNEAQPKFSPPGSWVLARGGVSGNRDRGSRSKITG